MLLVCQTRRGDFGYISGHMQWSYVYVQLSDCGGESIFMLELQQQNATRAN
jgi:hypothetical protein